MPVTTDKAAPYAPAPAVLDVINRYRSRGLQSPITSEVLGRAGVAESLIPRTSQALQALDLIDDRGMPSAILEGLRLAPEAEFKQRLLAWLNDAYADVLTFIDPMVADETQVRDAFRAYNPVGQQPRMVTLFLGLYAAAGVGPTKEEKPATARRLTRARIVQHVRNLKPVQRENANGGHNTALPVTLPPVLATLLSNHLPAPGKSWTKQERDRFYITFGTMLDFVVPIGDPVEDETAE